MYSFQFRKNAIIMLNSEEIKFKRPVFVLDGLGID